jgi:hypothetical protein
MLLRAPSILLLLFVQRMDIEPAAAASSRIKDYFFHDKVLKKAF